MPYQRRRYNSGGGAGGSFISRLFGGGDTAEANTKILTPGDVPYTYKGDPSTQVGKYSTSRGNISSRPYRDTRGFMGRAAGAPNTAEELNLQIAQMGLMGQITNDQKVALESALLPIERQRGFEATAGRQGLTPEQLLTLSPDQLSALQAAAQASVATSGEAKEKAITGIGKEKQTRRNQQNVARNQAQIASAQSSQQALESGTTKAANAERAAYLAQRSLPIAALQNALQMQVGQGNMLINPSVDWLYPGGKAPSLFPEEGIGYGGRTEQVEIPGQMIGNTGVRAEGTKINRTIPPSFRTKADPNIVSQVLGDTGQEQQPPLMLQYPGVRPTSTTQPGIPQSTPITPSSVYDIPPHIAKQLEDPRYTPAMKQQILMQYYQSLIGQQDPSLLHRLFPNDADAVFKRQKQEELRKLLTPNY